MVSFKIILKCFRICIQEQRKVVSCSYLTDFETMNENFSKRGVFAPFRTWQPSGALWHGASSDQASSSVYWTFTTCNIGALTLDWLNKSIEWKKLLEENSTSVFQLQPKRIKLHRDHNHFNQDEEKQEKEWKLRQNVNYFFITFCMLSAKSGF